MFSVACAWFIRGQALTLTRAPHMLSRPRKQPLFMSQNASPRAALVPTPRHEPAAPAPAVTHSAMANAIRALAMDAVERAKSGPPGLPMGAAAAAHVLFTRFLQCHPD